MANFSLLDVLTPYVFGGAAIPDPLHELLTVLFVQDVETSFDDTGVVVSGMARFSVEVTGGQLRYVPPLGFAFAAQGVVDHRTVRRPGAFWDFPDIAIRFRLTTPRTSSPVADRVVNGVGGPAAPPNAGARTVLGTRLGQGSPGDAPNTLFHLDLLIDAATLHLPFLNPATLGADGMLTPDPTIPDVTVTLPKIKLSIVQTAGVVDTGGVTDPLLTVRLDSWAAHDIDDPTGTASAELITMSPPYALIGPGDVVGFGFHSVVLDMSGTATPPELLSKFGVGDDFRGIYLPDVRVFVKFPGLSGLSIDVSARELLIGIGPEGGVSGIFGLDVVFPALPQAATIRVYDELGRLVTRFATPDQVVYPWTTPTVLVPAKTQWIADVTGGQPPYSVYIDGTSQHIQSGDEIVAEPVDVTLTPPTTAKDIVIDIADVHDQNGNPGPIRSITVPVVLVGQPLTDGAPGRIPPKGAQLTVESPGPPGYSITMRDHAESEKATLVFNPPAPDKVTIGSKVLNAPGEQVTIDVKHGEPAQTITAEWPGQAAATATLTAQFQYDQPKKVGNQADQNPDDGAWAAFAANAANVRTVPSADEPTHDNDWSEPGHFLIGSSQLANFVAVAKANPSRKIDYVGTASRESVPNPDYNIELSRRRIWVLRALLAKHEQVTNPDGKMDPAGEHPPIPPGPGKQPGRAAYRRVVASIDTDAQPGSSVTVKVSRPARAPAPAPVKPVVSHREAVGTDRIPFREEHIRIVIDHNRVIAIEVRLKIDTESALESYLKTLKGQAIALTVRRADADDGVLDIRVQLTLDDTVGAWHVVASLFENDPDGLLQTPPPTEIAKGEADDQLAIRSYFGLMIALVPLFAAGSGTSAGELAPLKLAALVGLAAPFVDVPRITLYGGELTVGHDNAGTRAALLLDVEVALLVKLTIGGVPLIKTRPDSPITVRYKAIGFATSNQPQLGDLAPVFDSSKGYTINVPSTGGIQVPDPLGDILQVAGARVARSNPANLELDLELKADLGVVSVDRTTIRIPLGEDQAPTLSALGVHIDIPGAIEGHGYLAIFKDGFAGQLDVSLPGIGVRVAAGLSVCNVVAPDQRSATAVMLTLEVDFPVPIVLGGSGLGIYGFGGLFALHHRRKENPNAPVPALDWLQNVVAGNPMDVKGWEPDIDHWSIGLGAVLGTLDSGITLNVKGMLIFEMPGPRILLAMKANLLAARPQRQGKVTATILAIIDVDLGRGRVSIGLSFDYEISPLLRLNLPVRAIFPFEDAAHFAIDAGTWYSPATVEFFKLFKARGYFIIRGRGIPDSDYDKNQAGPPFAALGGFAIATGASTSYIWGKKGNGLYLSVGSSFDVGLGFSPVRFSGTLRLWGELHLWIIGIEAAARLSLTAGQVEDQGEPRNQVLIDGEVHGSIDLFFFTLEGSVHVTLGDDPPPPPDPPALVTGVSLQSRAAALLTGTSADRPIDGKLTDARPPGESIPDEEAVPIDAIIVLHLDCTPRIKSGAVFSTGQDTGPVTVPIGSHGGPAAPAVRRGEPYYTYRITGVTLDNGLTKGEVPIVWWPAKSDLGGESKRELALLTRTPDPHPCAVERSRHQEDIIERTWGTVCVPVAPATSVLWTFHGEPLGPSPVGWVLPAGIPWPDPPGASRSQPPNLRLDVAETWRSGNLAADLLVDIAPARVIGGDVECAPQCSEPGDPRGTCRARVLEAPFQRPLNPRLIANHPLGGVLTKLMTPAPRLGIQPLDDVIAFATGEITHVRMLLLVPTVVLDHGALNLRCFDAKGKLLDQAVIDGTQPPGRIIQTVAELPESWRDQDGPWWCRVAEVVTYLTGTKHLKEGFRLVLVDTEVETGTTYLNTGLTRGFRPPPGKSLGRPTYVVGVVETLSAAEVAREDIDTTTKQHAVQTIEGALSGMMNPPALLRKNLTYTVTVTSEWTTCKADGGGVDENDWTPSTQQFSFRTDAEPLRPKVITPPEGGGAPPAAVLPARLDPWVLLTDPDEGEHFFFSDNPIRVVFAVDYLLDMFDAYGVTLEARVRAASHANADDPQTSIGLAVDDLVAPPLGASVPTPLQATLHDLVAGTLRPGAQPLPCVETGGTTGSKTVLDLNLLLEPRTDYVFDIEPTNAAPGADGVARPLFRRAFTTSRYRSTQALCDDVAAAAVRQFPATAEQVHALGELEKAPRPIAGAMLDTALRQAGLRPVVDVGDPEVEILWVPGSGGVQQPRVLVIRTPEPLVRTRRQPVDYEPPGQPRLGRKVIRLEDRPYLEIMPAPGGPNLHILSQPGLGVVIVIVDDGRGKPLGLELREHRNPFLGEAGPDPKPCRLLKLQLDAAIWEVG